MGIDWVDGEWLLEWQTGICEASDAPVQSLSDTWRSLITGWNWGLVEYKRRRHTASSLVSATYYDRWGLTP